MGQSNGPIERIRVDLEKVSAYLEKLDADRQSAPKGARRQNARFSYRVRELLIELEEQPGNWRRFGCPTRDISATGMSFLMDHFVYPSTPARVFLTSLQNARSLHTGRVIRCRYLTGSARLHDVGVLFDHPIDVSLFHRGAAPTRMLLVDDDPMIHRLAPKLLRNLHVNLTSAENGRQAVELAMAKRFELIVMDVEMPELDGISAAREMRAAGCTAPLVAITSKADPETRQACLDAGYDHFVGKPLNTAEFTAMVQTYQFEPVVSSLLHDTIMADIIDDFVDGLQVRIRDIFLTMSRNDVEALGERLNGLRADAGTAGFESIAAVGQEVIALLQNDGDRSGLKTKLAQLARLCNSARGVSCREVI